MNRLLLGSMCFVSICLFGRAQAPQSLAGLTMIAEYSEHEPFGSDTLEVIDFLNDGTFAVRVSLQQKAMIFAGNGSDVVYTAPFTGTYRYQVSSPNSAVLSFSPFAFPDDFPVMKFTSSNEGVMSLTPPASPQISVRFSLAPTGGISATRSLVNISTLVTARRGESITIGFVLAGTAFYREVLIRAVGPSLSAFGVSSPAANPSFNFPRTPRVLNSISGWSDNAAAAATIAPESARAGAFSLAKGSKDKAEIFLLPPGAYTITVAASTADQEGAELIEVYEIP